MAEKQSKVSKRGGARPGAGRPKGALDKGNALIRDMICDAVTEVGGVQYFAGLALSHPAAFASLVGKVMPVQIEGTGKDGAISHSLVISFK